MSQHAEQKLTMTVVEAARLLGIGKNQAYYAVKTGQIPSIVLGGTMMVPREALLETLRNPKPNKIRA